MKNVAEYSVRRYPDTKATNKNDMPIKNDRTFDLYLICELAGNFRGPQLENW
jgi:hypothetical protein